MTNKQTIDGVSRGLLEDLYNGGYCKPAIMAELRALLDNPVAQFQSKPVAVELFQFEFTHDASGEKQVVGLTKDEVFSVMEDDLFEKIGKSICNCEPVGETNVVDCGCESYIDGFSISAAQPQDEVEGLREELDLIKISFDANFNAAQEARAERDTLRAQLAEQNALLRDAARELREPSSVGWEDALASRIEIILSTSVEPKPRGEAVAYLCRNARHPIPRLRTEWEPITVEYARARMHNKALAEKGKADEYHLGDEFQPLFTEQPSHSGDANEMVAKVAPDNNQIAGCCCPPKGHKGAWAAAMCPVHFGLKRRGDTP